MDKFVPYNNCKAVCYVDGEYMVKRVEIYFVLTYHIIYKNGTFSLFYDRLSKITYCLLNYFFKANLQIPFCSPLASELKMVAKIPQINRKISILTISYYNFSLCLRVSITWIFSLMYCINKTLTRTYKRNYTILIHGYNIFIRTFPFDIFI